MRAPGLMLIALCAVLIGCTTVTVGPDDTSSITYTGEPAVGKDLADRACRRAGQESADLISIENKDVSLPPGAGKQVITFRCSSVERQ
jgi:hypothetical protein